MTQYVYAGAAPFAFADNQEHPGGLLRQVVGESEWRVLGGGLPDKAEVRAIAIHPDNPHIIYAGTQYGPYRSMDSGERWQRLDFPDGDMVVWSIIFHPQNPQILYLGTAPSAIYRSDNGGDSWQRLSIIEPAGMVEMGFPCRIIRLAADPSNPDEIYAGLEVGGVIRSLDGGETWDDCTRDLLNLAQQQHLKSQLISNTDTEGMMDSHALSLSAARPGTVFLATRMGLFCSPDRGESWQDMEIWRSSPLSYARDIQVAPHDPNTLYTALSPAALSKNGSLYRSQDLGQTWQRFDHNVVPRTTMMAVALSRQDPRVVYCATRGGQIFGTQDGGATWNEFSLPEGLQDVYAIACG
jgi:photosystem II stability/assembly factor-like uncharacterized protein